eukprot:GHRR01029620.1.p1 GENE.GHRR01029620.1~~GHRR01029620.1.p1  ORF type:complete len:113 (+),score=28.80 GHRR01029620.1:739-1077(+)
MHHQSDNDAMQAVMAAGVAAAAALVPLCCIMVLHYEADCLWFQRLRASLVAHQFLLAGTVAHVVTLRYLLVLQDACTAVAQQFLASLSVICVVREPIAVASSQFSTIAWPQQ